MPSNAQKYGRPKNQGAKTVYHIPISPEALMRDDTPQGHDHQGDQVDRK